MKTLIIDFGMGNLGSVRRAFEECGADAFISDDPGKMESADHVVLPGVGAFVDGMARLRRGGWEEAIQEAVIEDAVPLLGICLGMQLLADNGYEGGEECGLKLIPGEVRRLDPVDPLVRVPHVGWNEVHRERDHPLFSGIANGSDFYFVHSYHFIPLNPDDVLATTPYCGSFVSAVQSGNALGVQFHPEKSGQPGFRLLRNFLKWRGGLC
ncbi:MAG: imidazole glycerol phosphate synthase subunit HisH [Nitrospiraceae bacterium]|nr:imidazole glycerol phosphate synthase subunit HisH [Nitrospiraceae bacterium]